MKQLKKIRDVLLYAAITACLVLHISSFTACSDDGYKDTMNMENNIDIIIAGLIAASANSDIWVKIGTIATPRSGTAMAEHNGWLYFYGGEDFFGYTSHFWRYEIDRGRVEILTGDEERAYSTITSVGNMLYLIGGISKDIAENDVYHYDVKSYNIATGVWSDLITNNVGDIFPPRAYHTAIRDGNDIFVHGGYGTTLTSSTAIIHEGYAYEFDTTTHNWTEKEEGPQRMNASAAVIGNKMYIFGGYGRNNLDICDELKDEIWLYDTSGNQWSLESALPGAAREAAGIVALNDILYIYGGKAGNACLNDTWRYSPSTEEWKQLSQGPGSRSHFSSASYNGLFIIFGGYNLVDAGQKVFNSDIWSYNP